MKVLHAAQIKRHNEVRHITSERNVLLWNIEHPFLVGLHCSAQTKAPPTHYILLRRKGTRLTTTNGGELCCGEDITQDSITL